MELKNFPSHVSMFNLEEDIVVAMVVEDTHFSEIQIWVAQEGLGGDIEFTTLVISIFLDFNHFVQFKFPLFNSVNQVIPGFRCHIGCHRIHSILAMAMWTELGEEILLHHLF